jgi:hypothetical protein
MFGGEKSLTEKVKEVLSSQATAVKEALVGNDTEHDTSDFATSRPAADISTMDKDDMPIPDTHPGDDVAMRDFAAVHQEQDLPFAQDDSGMHTAPDDLRVSKPESLETDFGGDKRSMWEKAKDAVSGKATAAKETVFGKDKDEIEIDRTEVVGREKYGDAVPVDDADKENRSTFGNNRSPLSKAKDAFSDKAVAAKDAMFGQDKENRPEVSSMDRFEAEKEKPKYAVPIGKDEAEREARETGKMIDQTKGGIAEKVGHAKKSI